MADEIARLGLALDTRSFVAEGAGASRTLDDIRSKAAATADAADSAASALQRASNQLKSMAMLAGIGLGVREVINMADQYKLLEGRLKMVTKGNQDLMQTEAALFAMAQRTRSGYTETAELFTKVARNGASLGKTNAELMQFTESVQKSIAIGGASAGESSAAVLQLGQALASGVLRGDEFRSIMENASGMAIYLAKGLGVTVGQLRSMAMEGKLTADVVTAAMAKMKDRIDEDFKNVPMTVGHSFTMLKNEVMRFVGETDRSFTATSALSDAIVLLSKNIGPLLNGLAAVGLVMGAKWLSSGISSLITFIAQTATATAATIAHTEALAMNAAANEGAAMAAVIGTRANQQLALQRVTATLGTVAETEAIVALEVATQTAALAEVEMAAAVAATTAAEAGMTLGAMAAATAMGVLETAMAFFGGPIGLAVMAVAAGIYLIYKHIKDVNQAKADAAEAERKHAQEIFAGNAALDKQNKLTDRQIANIREQRAALETGGKAALEAVKQEQGAVDKARSAWDKYRETTANNKDKALEYDDAIKSGNKTATAFLATQRTIASETKGVELAAAYAATDREMSIALDTATRLADVKLKEAGVGKDLEAQIAAEAKARALGTSATEDQRRAVADLSLAEYARTQQGEANSQIKGLQDSTTSLREQITALNESEGALTRYNEQQAIQNKLDELSATVKPAQRDAIRVGLSTQQELNKVLEETRRVREAEQGGTNANRLADAALEGESATKALNQQLQIEAVQRKYGNDLSEERAELLRREIAAIVARNTAEAQTDYNKRTEDIARSTTETERMTAAIVAGSEAVRQLNIDLAIEAENRTRANKMTPDEERRRRLELEKQSQAERNQTAVKKQVDDTKAIWDNMIREMQSGFTDMIAKTLTEGIRGLTGFLDLVKGMVIKMFAELISMQLMRRLMAPNTGSGGIPVPGSPDGTTSPATGGMGGYGGGLGRGGGMAAVGLAGLAAGYGMGQAVYSDAHGSVGNYARGALSGAASGAATGAMMGAALGPVGAAAGAVVGGLAGLAGGILGVGGAAKQAAKQMAEAQKQLALDMASLRATANRDSVASGIAGIEADREARRKQIEDAYSGGGAGSEQVRKRNAALAEMNALEDKRIAQLKDEAATAKKNFAEDLGVRLLVAQGKNKDADRLRLDLAQQREYAEAVKNNTDEATLALLRQVQAQEKVAAEANNVTSALLNVPNAFKLAQAQYNAMIGVGGVTPAPLPPVGSTPSTPFDPTPPDEGEDKKGRPLTIPIYLDGKTITNVVIENFEQLSGEQNGNTQLWASRGVRRS